MKKVILKVMRMVRQMDTKMAGQMQSCIILKIMKQHSITGKIRLF
jgi:hypothetical protein